MAVQWYGNAVLNLTYKNSRGDLGNRILYREDEGQLSLQDASLPWSFDADGAKLRLASEAWRIHYAHLFDPYLAVHTSDVEPLPHQISAVYQEMLGRLPLRYVLADDPGAGKTIMTGLFIKELIARGDLRRCLIVSPGSLAEQWQDELFQKFHLRFEILTNDRFESAVTGNAFDETPLAIARLDKLARNEAIQEKLKATDWDLIVCDEAHKMSATVWGGEVKMTRRFQLGRLLSGITRHMLLLTATPHNGKEEDFQLFLSLVDQDRFGGVARTGSQAIDISDVMRRLVKEELLKFDGSPLFPERHAVTVNYSLSPEEAELYEAVTAYVQNEFNRAEELAARLKQRTDELAAERLISAQPPVVIGGALVIPAGLLARLTNAPLPTICIDAAPRRVVELAAMRAVMEAEKAQGHLPRDVSAEKCGYDIESYMPDVGNGLPGMRFIEVKGRAAGADTVTVSRNEILTALNLPEQFILALVDVDGAHTHTVYLKHPFVNPPDFSVESTTFNKGALLERSKLVYENDEILP